MKNYYANYGLNRWNSQKNTVNKTYQRRQERKTAEEWVWDIKAYMY